MEVSLKDQFLKEGYVIIDVLKESEIEGFRTLMDALLNPEIKADPTGGTLSAAFQHLGDQLADFGKEARQYYFHRLTKRGTESIHHAFHHPVILAAVEQILGP